MEPSSREKCCFCGRPLRDYGVCIGVGPEAWVCDRSPCHAQLASGGHRPTALSIWVPGMVSGLPRNHDDRMREAGKRRRGVELWCAELRKRQDESKEP